MGKKRLVGGCMLVKRLQHGYTLTEAILAIGIFTSILLSLIIGYKRNLNQIAVLNRIKKNKLLIEHTIRNRIDCNSIPTTCANGDNVIAYDKIGDILIDDVNQNPTFFGRWQVKMECEENSKINVKIARTKNGVTFSKHPTTGDPLDWSHSDSVLTNRDKICPLANDVDNYTIIEGDICTVTDTTEPPCILSGGGSLNCPCPASNPNPCPPDTVYSHMIDDSFGGRDVHFANYFTYGRQKLRYCAKN